MSELKTTPQASVKEMPAIQEREREASWDVPTMLCAWNVLESGSTIGPAQEQVQEVLEAAAKPVRLC